MLTTSPFSIGKQSRFLPAARRLQDHPSTSGVDLRWSRGSDARAGLTEAEFEDLVAPFIPDMLRASRSIVGSDDVAWDAVQETLLRLWTRGWLPDQPVAALVHLTVKSSLHQLRCQRRRSLHESKDESIGRPCCGDDPLAAAESTEEAALVRDAVRGLTEEYRTVVEAFTFEGESYEAIAERLSLPIGTVRSRLSRGRALLRERLHATLAEA